MTYSDHIYFHTSTNILPFITTS